MRRPRVLSTAAAMTQEKPLELANDFEPNFAAKTRADVFAHQSAPSVGQKATIRAPPE